MIKLSESTVTGIQFFDHTRNEQTGENEHEQVKEYSANIIINNELIIQLSGNGDEAHKTSIPSSDEQYYNNEELQDWAEENLNIDDVEKFLDDQEVTNSFDFLNENSTETHG